MSGMKAWGREDASRRKDGHNGKIEER